MTLDLLVFWMVMINCNQWDDITTRFNILEMVLSKTVVRVGGKEINAESFT